MAPAARPAPEAGRTATRRVSRPAALKRSDGTSPARSSMRMARASSASMTTASSGSRPSRKVTTQSSQPLVPCSSQQSQSMVSGPVAVRAEHVQFGHGGGPPSLPPASRGVVTPRRGRCTAIRASATATVTVTPRAAAGWPAPSRRRPRPRPRSGPLPRHDAPGTAGPPPGSRDRPASSSPWGPRRSQRGDRPGILVLGSLGHDDDRGRPRESNGRSSSVPSHRSRQPRQAAERKRRRTGSAGPRRRRGRVAPDGSTPSMSTGEVAGWSR